jgi:hypothetical protein
MDTSEAAYDRLDTLQRWQEAGRLEDESSDQVELSVLRVLLFARPGDEVTFEASFPHLCRYADDETGKMKEYHDRTLEAWEKVRSMIGAPAGS